MVSRNDVAKEAGVSPTSVSYYINQSGYVSEAAGKRIQAAIDKLHYRPNQMAKSLKTKNSRQFVFLCNEIRNPFFAQLIADATTAAYERDYSILFSNVIDDETYLTKLCGYQASGVFLPSARVSKEVVEAIQRMGISVVMLNDASWKQMPEGVTQVRSAAEMIYPQILQHLKENGYKRFTFVSSAPDAEHRKNDDKAQIFLRMTGLDPHKDVLYNVNTVQEAEKKILMDWKPKEEPEAILCSNDFVAQGVIYALTELGVSVPEQVGVVGYDNIVSSQFYIPSITSVDFGVEKLGSTIIDMLIERVEGKPVEDLVIPPVLVPRESTNRLKKIEE